MLKKDVLDPQGKVVQNTLVNMGMNNLKSIRQGKHFEIEIDEVEEAINEGGANQQNENLAEEIGDLLFAVTNLTRKIGMDSESLLAAANQKFISRFNEVEEILEKLGTNAVEADIQCMEKAWEKVKNKDS